MGLRSAVALDQGLTEEMLDKVESFEESDLSERHKVALRFAHAYLLHPTEVSEELKAQVYQYYTTEQIIELALRLSHNTIDRLSRAFGTDLDEVVYEVQPDL
jgi:hypothetical protein